MLSEEDKRRIEEEERYRAAVRSQGGAPTTEKKSSGCFQVFAVVAGVLALIFIVTLIPSNSDTSGKFDSASTVEQVPAPAHSGNLAHDMLISFDAASRTSALGKTAGCRAAESFFMGQDPKRKTAYWSVRCENGKSYQISINADAKGTTNILDCGVLRKMAHISCFEKMKD